MTSEFWSPFDRAQPRYARLGREIAEEIDGGGFPVGSLLPTEAQLCQRYGVSRHTVRAALKELQSVGLVTSHQGVGTRVVAVQPPTVFQATWRSMSEICDGNNTISYRCVGSRVCMADAELARRLGCTSGRAFACVRFVASRTGDKQGEPVGIVDVFIDSAFMEIAGQKFVSEAELMAGLETFSGQKICRIDLSFKIEAITEEKAQCLGRSEGEVLTSVRKSYSCTRIEQAVISNSVWLPGEFDLSYSFERKVQNI